MTREAQIRQTAADWLRYNNPKCTQDMLVEAFRCGAQWADEHPKSPWVSINERLPEEFQMVFVHMQGGSYDCAIYTNGIFERSLQINFGMKDGGYTTISWLQKFKSNITHWMPIQELKKGE